MLDPTSVSDSADRAKLGGHDGEVAWTILADHVGAFCQAWEAADAPPKVGDYAPAEPLALRRMALIELVKIDLEHRWGRNLDPLRIESYVDCYPELAEGDGRSPNDLVYEEYHVRRQCGEDVSPQEYLQRFPSQAVALQRLFGVDAVESTSLFVSNSASVDKLGDSIDDFDLLTKLGQGAFGGVYLARQRSMQRLVALKITATKSHEAQTLAQLDHPHIVRVHDERDVPEKAVRLLYMQYVAGTSLDHLIKTMRTRPAAEWSGAALAQTLEAQLQARGEPMHCDRLMNEASWTEVACRLGIQLASALEYAHGQGVLHRDLKPANVLLDARGAAKIVDFNISYCSKLDGATPAAYFGGSLAYMSPEQLQACDPDDPREPSSLDARSDIYSLAVVLWELLSGTRPFHDETVDASWPRTLQAAALRRETAPSGESLIKLPFPDTEPVADVLRRCLQPTPNDRYKSAAHVARQLALCLEPHTRRLLRPPPSLWREAVRRWPLLILLTLIVLPNVVAAVFNFVYNDAEIIRQFPDAKAAFSRSILVINGIAFPIGVLICALTAWPVARACQTPSPLAADVSRLRKRCVSLGHWGAMLGVLEWMIAGIAFPVAIHWAGITLSPEHYFHFIASLALCGTITATYPFFLITGVCVRHLYPLMLVESSVPLEEVALLRRVQRRTWPYLALAAVLPLAGVALLVLLGRAQNQLALGVLSVGGLVGFSWVFWQARSLQKTLGHLAEHIESLNAPLETLADSSRSYRP